MNRRELIKSAAAAAAIISTSNAAQSFPIPGEPVPAPGAIWDDSRWASPPWRAVAAGWVDGAANSDWHPGVFIVQAMGMSNLGQFHRDGVAAGLGHGSDIVQARDIYLRPDLKQILTAATDAGGFLPINGGMLRDEAIDQATDYLLQDEAELDPVTAEPLPIPFGRRNAFRQALQGHCNAWTGGIIGRWNRLVPITRRPAMDENQRATFFNNFLETSGMEWREKRDFWLALPAPSSWDFAHMALRSWKEYWI